MLQISLLGIMHVASPLAKSPLISSYSSKKCLAKISVATSQNDLQFIFTADGWRMYSFNLPLSAPACCWVPFRLSKHRLPNILSQHQSNSQAELSKPTREDFKISKRNRTRSLSEYIPIYQSSLQCGFCTHHLVTRPVSKGGLRPHGKTFSSPEKNVLGIVYTQPLFSYMLSMYNLGLSENSSPLWCPKLVTGLLVVVALWLLSVTPLSSVFSHSNFSGLTYNFNKRN